MADETLDLDDAPRKRPDDGALTDNPSVKGVDVDHAEALERYHRGWECDRLNIEKAYEDLHFLAGYQWPEDLAQQRIEDSRPVLTMNRCPQFVRQVTGDIRQMKPAIRVVPVNNGADEKIAEIRAGLIRHIEQQSQAALDVYVDAADSQVAGGIGHWEVAGVYSDELDYEQNLVLRTLDDQLSVIWDPDARSKTRAEAMFCFVPVDMSVSAFKNAYPGHAVASLESWADYYADNWYADDKIRVCRYWYKKQVKRKLVKMPNGTTQDVTRAEPGELDALLAQGGVEFEREGHEVYWRMMNGAEFLTEPKLWPGRFIPIVPVIGEEVKVGSRVERHGIIRFLQDPQRAYNYARSTETEFVGLQPKAPFVGTDVNFRDYEEEWATANVKNWPYLRYTPDPKNGSAAPQRQMPPTTTPGLQQLINDSLSDMQGVVGIYNASLGARSNEDSGVAIRQREAQSDTNSYVYMANFAVAIWYTAVIINDLIPHYYDTARTIRIVGADAKSRRVAVNQPSMQVTLDGVEMSKIMDMTVGTYDIEMEMGPSYATQREAARAGMADFIKAFPAAAPVLADMFAELQDWPRKDDVSERLQTLLPPPLQAKLAQQEGKPPPPPPQPDPAVVAEAKARIARSASDEAIAGFDVERKKMELAHQQLLNVKAEMELLAAQAKLEQATSLNPDKVNRFMEQADEAMRILGEHAAAQMPDIGPAQELPAASGPVPEPEAPPMNPGPVEEIPPAPANPGPQTAGLTAGGEAE